MSLTAMLVFAIVIELSALLLFKMIIYRKWKTKTQRFQLFKIRDELVSLVAEGKLLEDEFLFQYFYTAVNYLIQNTRQLNLKTFVSSISEEINAASKNLVLIVEAELAQKNDDDVSKTIASLYSTVADITLSNSVILQLLVRFVKFSNKNERLSTIKKLRVYEDYKSASCAIYATA